MISKSTVLEPLVLLMKHEKIFLRPLKQNYNTIIAYFINHI